MKNEVEASGMILKHWSKRYRECEAEYLALKESYNRADDQDVAQELNIKLMEAEIKYNEATEELKKARIEYLVSEKGEDASAATWKEWKHGRLPN